MIFLSYSRKNKDFVDLLHLLLKAEGYKTWIDRENISVGVDWRSAIGKAIRESKCFIVVFSKDAAKSDEVKKEFEYALSVRVPILPIVYRDCEIPFGINHLNRVEFTKRSDTGEAFKKLAEALHELCPPEDKEVSLRTETISKFSADIINIYDQANEGSSPRKISSQELIQELGRRGWILPKDSVSIINRIDKNDSLA